MIAVAVTVAMAVTVAVIVSWIVALLVVMPTVRVIVSTVRIVALLLSSGRSCLSNFDGCFLCVWSNNTRRGHH